jgi:hypothetical protein
MLSFVHSVIEKALPLRLSTSAGIKHDFKIHEIIHVHKLYYSEVRS